MPEGPGRPGLARFGGFLANRGGHLSGFVVGFEEGQIFRRLDLVRCFHGCRQGPGTFGCAGPFEDRECSFESYRLRGFRVLEDGFQCSQGERGQFSQFIAKSMFVLSVGPLSSHGELGLVLQPVLNGDGVDAGLTGRGGYGFYPRRGQERPRCCGRASRVTQKVTNCHEWTARRRLFVAHRAYLSLGSQ